ncbi:MAG: SecDF P1 head subdomain-containing protein, partial [Luteimonas sp.]
MLEFPRWKHVLIVLVALFGLLYALPNMYPQDPSVQVTASRGNQVTQALGDRVRNQLDEAGVEVKSIDVDAANGNMMVRLPDLDAQTQASDLLRENLGQDYSVALNLASTVPDWLTGFGASPMVLGLDLQGGVHFVMQVDQAAALERRLESYAEGIRATLRDNRIRYTSVERSGDDSIQAVLSDEADISQAMQLMAVDQPTLNRSVSGNRITTRVPESELGQIARDAIDQNITTLRNRVDEVGVAEPVIQRQGDDRVVVQLPGVQDTAEAKRMIGATATLAYYAVLDGDAYEAARTGVVPPEGRIYYTREPGLDGNPMPYILSRRVIATGEEMVNAQSTYDQNGLPAVSVTLNATAGKRMFDFTSMNVGRPMAVVYIERVPQVRMVDGEEVRTFRDSEEIISVANIQGVFSREFQTTGLEKQEADDLARMLRSGSLAAPMDFIEERIVGPSLGAENV